LDPNVVEPLMKLASLTTLELEEKSRNVKGINGLQKF
jgi:hypothetical protein